MRSTPIGCGLAVRNVTVYHSSNVNSDCESDVVPPAPFNSFDQFSITPPVFTMARLVGSAISLEKTFRFYHCYNDIDTVVRLYLDDKFGSAAMYVKVVVCLSKDPLQ